MKKYNKPVIEIVELQSKENIAAANPLNASTTYNDGGVVTTVYNLAILGVSSVGSN